MKKKYIKELPLNNNPSISGYTIFEDNVATFRTPIYSFKNWFIPTSGGTVGGELHLNGGENTSIFSVSNPNETILNIDGENITTTINGTLDLLGNVNVKHLIPNNTNLSGNLNIGLTVLTGVTTGNNNIGIGQKTLSNITDGWNNVSIGQFSGLKNTSGHNNVSYGVDSLVNNIKGLSNTSIGTGSLYYSVSGSNNTAIGQNAGRYNKYAGLVVPNNCVYVGDTTRSGSYPNNPTNEIVIGGNSIGNGTNTVTLGNAQTECNYLHGNLKIDKKVALNTTDFTSNLSINSNDTFSNIKITSSYTPESIQYILSPFIGDNSFTLCDNYGNPRDYSYFSELYSYFKSGDTVYFSETDAMYEISSIDPNALLVYLTTPLKESYDGLTQCEFIFKTTPITVLNIESIGTKNELNNTFLNTNLTPITSSFYSLGTSANKWNNIYAMNGVIQTSDARLKTTVSGFTADELNASIMLSKEIGVYRFLSSITNKGENNARKHIGITVQKVMEIMTSNNLNPFDYGFVCYDSWSGKTTTHPEIPEVIAKPSWVEEIKDNDGNVIDTITHPEIVAKKGVPAFTEIIKESGDLYSLRYDELLMFISRGFEERLKRLEEK